MGIVPPEYMEQFTTFLCSPDYELTMQKVYSESPDRPIEEKRITLMQEIIRILRQQEDRTILLGGNSCPTSPEIETSMEPSLPNTVDSNRDDENPTMESTCDMIVRNSTTLMRTQASIFREYKRKTLTSHKSSQKSLNWRYNYRDCAKKVRIKDIHKKSMKKQGFSFSGDYGQSLIDKQHDLLV